MNASQTATVHNLSHEHRVTQGARYESGKRRCANASRLEGAAVLIVAAGAYAQCAGHGWGFFAALFLVPDVSLAGYLAGPRAGARVYNTFHAYLGPLALISAGAFAANSLATDLALIWIAHIGMDRALGYGLKYVSSFGDTHLGKIGK